MTAIAGPLRFGILGTARIARQKVIPGIRAAAGCEVVAIASRSAETAGIVAGELGIASAYGSYEELLASPDVDAVYIPLPNHLHATWSMAAMKAGKHVLCEKPIAMDAVEAGEMVSVADATGTVLMEAFMYKLHPLWGTAVDMVRSGRIGDLVSVQSWFSFFNDDADNIRNVAAFGGGALMDIGCYNVSLSRLLFAAEPDDVSAVIHRDPVSGVDVATSAVLTFGGRSATFTCSIRAASDQRVHIVGTDGRLEIDVPFNIPPDTPTHIHLWERDAGPLDGPAESVEIASRDPYAVQAEAFAAAVGGAALPVTAADSVGNMAVIDAIVAAAG